VLKSDQTPFGEMALERHVYQSSEGGQTSCPLDQQARIVSARKILSASAVAVRRNCSVGLRLCGLRMSWSAQFVPQVIVQATFPRAFCGRFVLTGR